jgi:hypothetical protein
MLRVEESSSAIMGQSLPHFKYVPSNEKNQLSYIPVLDASHEKNRAYALIYPSSTVLAYYAQQ